MPAVELLRETEKIIYTVSTQAKNGVFFVVKSVTYEKLIFWSGREDSNLRPPHPQCDALPGCATSRPAIRRTMAPALERGLYGQRFRKARGQSRYPLRGKWQHDNGPPLE